MSMTNMTWSWHGLNLIWTIPTRGLRFDSQSCFICLLRKSDYKQNYFRYGISPPERSEKIWSIKPKKISWWWRKLFFVCHFQEILKCWHLVLRYSVFFQAKFSKKILNFFSKNLGRTSENMEDNNWTMLKKIWKGP